jgi:ribosomal protein L24
MMMFLFGSWIDYFIHGLLIISLIGTLSGTILGWIPFVRKYGTLIKGISILFLVASIFFEGYLFSHKRFQAQVKEYQDKIAIAEAKYKEVNEKIKTVVVEKVKIIKETTNENKTAINKYVTDECQLSSAAVILHDSASQNVVPPSTIGTVRGTSKVKVPELLTTVTDNYGTCYESREKLKAWQDWYKNQKEIFESVK